QYKKKFVLPGTVIPELNKPKNFDSFLFSGLYHLAVCKMMDLSSLMGLRTISVPLVSIFLLL
ncbi:hypothetical protein CONPUDRAFT_63482, partial [Coniophora puteana RWD-64-598 SS2]